ncbi:MAG: hypothetical protein ACLQLG_17445 [Thermoguttaceae bacterium]
MTAEMLYRIQTPEGLVSYDVFTLARPQPAGMRIGCVLVIDQNNGNRMTVHKTRLIPAAIPTDAGADDQQKSICLKCGRVEGVVEDQVQCPHHHDADCGLIEAPVSS